MWLGHPRASPGALPLDPAEVMRQLAGVMREGQWKVTAAVIRRRRFSELVDVRPGNGTEASLGLAIDVGTTTIVVYLVDMADGTVRAATSGHNRQAACGDDVINRIVCAEKDGIRKLNAMALATINSLVGEALDSAGAQAAQVRNVVVAGNTVMTHLLLQIEPCYIFVERLQNQIFDETRVAMKRRSC